MEYHVAFVPRSEILLDVFGPLVGFGKQHAVRIVVVHDLADVLEDRMCFGKILARGALTLNEIGHGVEPQTVDAHVEPEAHR